MDPVEEAKQEIERAKREVRRAWDDLMIAIGLLFSYPVVWVVTVLAVFGIWKTGEMIANLL